MSQSNYVFLDDCKIIRKTDKAILIIYCCGDEEHREWFPLSQVEDQADHLDEGDENVTVGITQWIANQKGIEVGS